MSTKRKESTFNTYPLHAKQEEERKKDLLKKER